MDREWYAKTCCNAAFPDLSNKERHLVKRILLAAIFALPLVACATTSEDGEDTADNDRNNGLHCTKVHEVGSRKPVEVCR